MTDSTDTRIRRAMANSTKGETGRMTLPPWVRDLDVLPTEVENDTRQMILA